MALISIVAATVMQAVGDSLARGLGMLGALAIIRFRTNLDNPLSITYMFASLAVGISCGVFGFTIAFAGTLTFCAAALLLHYSHFWGTESLRGNFRVNLDLIGTGDKEIEKLLALYCKSFKLDQIRIENSEVNIVTEEIENEEPADRQATVPAPTIVTKELFYIIWMNDQKQAPEFMEKVYKLSSVKNARIRFSVPDPNL